MFRVARAVGMPLLVRRSSVPLVAGPRRSTLCASLTGIRHFRAPRTLLAASPSPNIEGAAPSSPPPTPSEQQQTPEETSLTEKPAASQLAPPATGSSDTAADAAPQSSQAQTVVEAIARPESAMRRLFASWQQGVVASIGAVMGIGFLLYFLYTPVKEDTVHHTAVVASEALGDARLKGQAVQLSKDVVLEVLRDPKSLDAAVDVVVGLLAREETKIAVSSLLQSLFEDHYTQEVTKKFVLQVVQDPWIQDQLQGITEEQVRKLLRNPEIKKSLSDFLLSSAVDSLEKPQFHYEVARAIRQSAASVFNFWWK